MKIGLSSYSMDRAIKSGTQTILEVMDFAHKEGAAHIELVPFGFTLYDEKSCTFNEPLIAAIREKSKELSLPISNYAVLGDLLHQDTDTYRAELTRLMRHIDVAEKLGIRQMGHGVASFRRPLQSNTARDFEHEFARMTEACRTLCDYARARGITTLVENHGFFVNGSDRVIRLIEAVDSPSFRMVVDTGNFACMDEDCTAAVIKCLPYAAMIHLKDFYVRPSNALPGIGGLFRCDSGNWFSSVSGISMLRGAILGQGDLDTKRIVHAISASGYSGYVSVEFEGMEPPHIGSSAGLEAARYFAEHAE